MYIYIYIYIYIERDILRGYIGQLLDLATLDLRAAYKQFPLPPRSRALSVLVLKTPATDEVACFEAKALPFKGTACVVHFNRAARLLWAIGEHVHVCLLSFFDDYPVVTPKLLGPSTKQTLKAIVDLLGFDCVWEKMNDFSPCAAMLFPLKLVRQFLGFAWTYQSSARYRL